MTIRSDSTSNASPPAAVKSAHRVLELLEYFADVRGGATVKEISQSLGYPQSSTSVLMRFLKDSGYFDHDARTGLYAPNIRLSLVTGWIGEQSFSEGGLLRLMHAVHEACGHTVMIGKQHGVHVRYLHVLQATRPERFTAKIGSLRPLFRSASGRMLLSTKTERELGLLLRRANALETDPALRIEEAQARDEWRKARTLGHALSLGTSVPGAAALAILLPVPRDHEPLALSVGGPMGEIQRDLDRLVRLLKEQVLPLREVVGRL